MQLLDGLSVLEVDFVFLAIAADANLGSLGQGVDNGNADTMKAARHLVAVIVELATCMKDGQNDLDGGDFLLGMLVNGDATTIIDNSNAVVFVNGHLNMRAEACKSLVNGIVHNLIHQMVQATRAR